MKLNYFNILSSFFRSVAHSSSLPFKEFCKASGHIYFLMFSFFFIVDTRSDIYYDHFTQCVNVLKTSAHLLSDIGEGQN